jgi:hypothetical protein
VSKPLIHDEQGLRGATVNGYKVRVWDDGSGPLWVLLETLGVTGIVRAETLEKAFVCAVDEIMDDADESDPDNRPDEHGNLPEGLHYRGSGVPSQEGLESPVAQEDVNGSRLERLTPELAEELRVEVVLST